MLNQRKTFWRHKKENIMKVLYGKARKGKYIWKCIRKILDFMERRSIEIIVPTQTRRLWMKCSTQSSDKITSLYNQAILWESNYAKFSQRRISK